MTAKRHAAIGRQLSISGNRGVIMHRLIFATALLAIIGWISLPGGAKSAKIPISNYDINHQIMVDEAILDNYHEEIAGFYKTSAAVRQHIWEKSRLFAKLLTDPETSKASIMTMQREIQQMTIKLQREELSFRWDLNNKFPEMATDRYRGCLSSSTGSIGPGRTDENSNLCRFHRSNQG